MSKLIVQMVINWETTLLRQSKYVASYHIPIHNQLIFTNCQNIIYTITLVLMSYWTFKNRYFKMIIQINSILCRCNKYSGMNYCNHNDWCNVWTFYNKYQPLKGFNSLSYRICVIFKSIPQSSICNMVHMKL